MSESTSKKTVTIRTKTNGRLHMLDLKIKRLNMIELKRRRLLMVELNTRLHDRTKQYNTLVDRT